MPHALKLGEGKGCLDNGTMQQVSFNASNKMLMTVGLMSYFYYSDPGE
jgi:hypothetical protein